MKLPQLTQPSRDPRREPTDERQSADLPPSRSLGVMPAGECGCEHHCIGPCVLGNCLGTCTPA